LRFEIVDRGYQQFSSADCSERKLAAMGLRPATVKVASAPATTQWLHSRNLDFCLLAICSCVLAVLCHQTIYLPSGQTNTSQAMSSRVPLSQLDFALKAGLFTSSQTRSEQDEELAE
jgi:hypothetical protein